MKRFIVETSDDGTEEKLRGLLYLGNESPRADAVGYMLNIVEVTEISNEQKRADGKPRMTRKQMESLWRVCGNYNVPFRENDYALMNDGMVEGWIGGTTYRKIEGIRQFGKTTIYVGVEPNGRVHS